MRYKIKNNDGKTLALNKKSFLAWKQLMAVVDEVMEEQVKPYPIIVHPSVYNEYINSGYIIKS